SAARGHGPGPRRVARARRVHDHAPPRAERPRRGRGARLRARPRRVRRDDRRRRSGPRRDRDAPDCDLPGLRVEGLGDAPLRDLGRARARALARVGVARSEKGDVTLSFDIRVERGTFSLALALEVPPGVTVLFGPSGAGKSLTLAALAGLVP